MALTTGGLSSEPTVRDGMLTRPLVVKLVLAGVLSVAVVLLVPHMVASGGDVPPAGMLLVTATIVGIICAVLLVWGLHSDLGLPAKTAVYALVFNVLVILVKLGLAPRGFYEVNQVKTIDSTFAIDNELMAGLAAGVVFVLYLGVYVTIYRFFRARVEHLAPDDPVPRLPGGRKIVTGVIILTVALVATGGALLLVLVPVYAGVEYVDFVFSSSLSLLIAVLLACATALAAMAFSSASDRARLVGDASLFMSFFWVGLFFLALYHVLWVVYVLVLTSIWPLKVVTPK